MDGQGLRMCRFTRDGIPELGEYLESVDGTGICKLTELDGGGEEVVCFASMFVRQVRQCFSAVWADGFPRCRHRFPVM